MPDSTKPDAAKPKPAKPHSAKAETADKASLNIQDNFLSYARDDNSIVTIFLINGVKLTGKIRSFDMYSVVLEANHQEQLIFKHAITTVTVVSRAARAAKT